MPFDQPTDPQPTSDERELLLRFLQTQRELVAWSTVGLTEDEARWQPDGKLIPIIGIVNHLTHVEWRWIDGSYARARRCGAARTSSPSGRSARSPRWSTPTRRGPSSPIATVREAPGLDAPCIRPEAHPEVDLRWVLVHLIEETAHHAGHADATREMLDGRQSGW